MCNCHAEPSGREQRTLGTSVIDGTKSVRNEMKIVVDTFFSFFINRPVGRLVGTDPCCNQSSPTGNRFERQSYRSRVIIGGNRSVQDFTTEEPIPRRPVYDRTCPVRMNSGNDAVPRRTLVPCHVDGDAAAVAVVGRHNNSGSVETTKCRVKLKLRGRDEACRDRRHGSTEAGQTLVAHVRSVRSLLRPKRTAGPSGRNTTSDLSWRGTDDVLIRHSVLEPQNNNTVSPTLVKSGNARCNYTRTRNEDGWLAIFTCLDSPIRRIFSPLWRVR